MKSPTNKNFEIKGLKEVEDALRTMPATLQADILKRINRDVLNKLLKPKLQSTPKTKKILATYSRSDKTAVTMGIARDYYWLRFLDKGTKQRQTRKSKANRGSISGHNIYTNTIESSTDPIIKKTRDEYSEMAIKHLNRKITQVNKKLIKL